MTADPSKVQEKSRAVGVRVVPLRIGVLLVAIYILLARVQPFQATAGRSFLYLSGDELRFWLAHWMLAAPGIILIVVAHGNAALRRMWQRLLALSPREWKLAAVCYVGLLTTLAVIGRCVFLLDQPITDDESIVLFGARMLVAGDMSVPILEPEGAFTEAFTYRRGGRVSSLAYPGAQLFRAATLVTGLGSLLYALAAAGAGLAVAASGRQLAGRAGAVVAACWWLCSPMAFTLAMTTHEHVVSRLFLTVTIWLYLRLINDAATGTREGAMLALAGGMAFLTRSAEAACVLLPIGVHLAMTSVQTTRIRQATAAAALVAIPVLSFYGWYNTETTGAWYLQARFGPGVHEVTESLEGTLLSRLGYNFGHNFLLLLVMALGPLGAVFVALGYVKKPGLSALGVGVILQFALALAHDDTGIHTVGPIHFR